MSGPFLVKLFYRTGAFHRTDEFAPAHQLPYVPAYVFSTCTLTQLTHILVAAQQPAVLPSPSVGTRIAFRLVHANDVADGQGQGLPRIVLKDLGSVVIGGGGPGAPTSRADLERLDDYNYGCDGDGGDVDALPAWWTKDNVNGDGAGDDDGAGDGDDAQTTLADTHFAIGDSISCAFMPPRADGCVVAAGDIRSGRGSGVGEATTASARPPPSPPRTWRRGQRAYAYWGGGSGPSSPGAAGPAGEWRRGDPLPATTSWVRDGGRRPR